MREIPGYCGNDKIARQSRQDCHRAGFENNLKTVKIGIVAKGLIIVAIPLVFECAVVVAMSSLETQAEVAAARAERAREISTLINELIQELYTGLQSVKLRSQEFSAGYDRKERIEAAKAKMSRLKALFKPSDIEDMATLNAVEKAIDEGNDMVQRAERAFLAGDKAEIDRIHNQSLHFAERVITPELIALGERQKAISAQDAPIQAAFRGQMRMLLLAALVLSILGSIVIALVTTRSVTKRLEKLADNSRRIAQGEELDRPMGGSDEISELDFTLHKMADDIEDLLLRERIILENARDIICVVDKNMRLQRVSPSVKAVLGYSPQELIGASCMTLLDRESAAATTISRFVLGYQAKDQVEAALKMRNGETLTTLVSLSYVSREENCILIFHDISELKKAERFKQDVINMVSHDLRSPLTMVGQIFEMFEEGMFGDINDDGMNMLHRAEQSTRQMQLLVSDLLDLEKIESGGLRLNRSTVSSLSILEKALALTMEQAATAKCQVRIGRSEGLVDCDPDRVNQILVNLIGNALKFSPPGKDVVISAIAQSPLIVFSVRDQGRGIPQEMQAKIFERFTQVQAKDSKGGLGLGLAICKALVEMHGGNIRVQSDKTGSIFMFTLPEVKRQFGPAVTKS